MGTEHQESPSGKDRRSDSSLKDKTSNIYLVKSYPHLVYSLSPRLAVREPGNQTALEVIVT